MPKQLKKAADRKPSKAPTSPQVSTRMTPELLDMLNDVAVREGVSRNTIVRGVLTRGLRDYYDIEIGGAPTSERS